MYIIRDVGFWELIDGAARFFCESKQNMFSAAMNGALTEDNDIISTAAIGPDKADLADTVLFFFN